MSLIAESLKMDGTALRGHLVAPEDPEYDVGRQVWNGSFDKRPALIARCAGVADVMAR